jgi:CBS domain-containing protein
VALERLQAQGIGAIVVTEEDRPLGVFTVRDLIGRVILPGVDLETPMGRIMTPEPVTLDARDHAFEAALRMAQGGFRHVLVVEGDRLVGVLSEHDLFSLQRVGLTRVAAYIQSAEDLPALQAAAADIRLLAHNLMRQGVTAEQLTRLISKLNDLLTTRLIELERRRHPAAASYTFCWLALGSEGRLEQTLNTDQDNGLIFEPLEGQSPEEARAALLPFARAVNEGLAACGFPLCKGEVMAGNPKWCLSLVEWQATFADWIFRGDGPVLLNASIFFDFRPLAGEARLAWALRDWLNEHVRGNRQFLRLMVQNALGNEPPLGWRGNFVLDGSGDEVHTLEMKLHGSMPFVDAARIFALAAGVSETGTQARLRAAGAAWKLDPQEVEAWVDGFFYIQQLRLQVNQTQLARDLPLSNRLDPRSLSAMEHQALKEAFRQAKRLQSRMETFFQF